MTAERPNPEHYLDTQMGRRLSAALHAIQSVPTDSLPQVQRKRAERALLSALRLEQIAFEGREPEDDDVVEAWDAVALLDAATREPDQRSRVVTTALTLGSIVVARTLRADGVRPWQVLAIRPKPGEGLGSLLLRVADAVARGRRPHGPTPAAQAGALAGPGLLRAAIEASGLSDVAFARDVLGVADRTVRYWLDGARPFPATPAKICRAILADPDVVESLRRA